MGELLFVVKKNITHPERGLVKPDDPDPLVNLDHLTTSEIEALIGRRVVAPKAKTVWEKRLAVEKKASEKAPEAPWQPGVELSTPGRGEQDNG